MSKSILVVPKYPIILNDSLSNKFIAQVKGFGTRKLAIWSWMLSNLQKDRTLNIYTRIIKSNYSISLFPNV